MENMVFSNHALMGETQCQALLKTNESSPPITLTTSSFLSIFK